MTTTPDAPLTERTDVTDPAPRSGSTPARPVTHAAPAPRALERVTSLMGTYSLPLLLLASVVAYGTWSKTSEVFLSAANMQNIAGSQSVLAVLTLGLLIPMICGNLDLSIGSTAGLASIASAASFATYDAPLPVGILVGVVVGALVGVVNGTVVTRLKIDSFIVTLGTSALILGLVNWYSEGQSIIQGIPASLISFGGGNWLGVPRVVYVLALVALVVYYVLEQTPYGRNLHAIGSNAAAARLVGIRVERDVLVAFVLSGAFAGLAGVLLLARSGAGNPQVGSGFTLTAIAAAFLGAASFTLGRLNVLGSLVAIFFLAVNITGLTFAGAANWISDVFTGLSLVMAVAFAGILSRPRKARTVAEPVTPASGPAPAAAAAP